MQFASVVEKRWWSNRAPEVEQFQPWLTRCSKVCNKKRNGEILGTFYQFQRGEFQRTLKKLEIPKYWVNAQGFFFSTPVTIGPVFFYIWKSPLNWQSQKTKHPSNSTWTQCVLWRIAVLSIGGCSLQKKTTTRGPETTSNCDSKPLTRPSHGFVLKLLIEGHGHLNDLSNSSSLPLKNG